MRWPVFKNFAEKTGLVSAYGLAEATSAVPGPFAGTGCGYFSGSNGSRLRLPDSAAWAFGTAPWTVEFWIRPVNGGHGSAYSRILETATWPAGGGLSIVTDNLTNPARLGAHGGSGEPGLWCDGTLPNDTWSYLALVFDGAYLTWSINGIANVTAAWSKNYTQPALSIGARLDGGAELYYGYLSNLRITQGVARDVSVVPAGPFPVGAADPHWSQVVLLVPMDFMDMAALFTPPVAPWILQPTPSGIYTIQPKRLDARAESLGDQWWGGLGRIAGTVQIKGRPDSPVARKVRLFDVRTGILVRETWSDPVTGAYAFTGLDPTRDYLALAHDHTRQYNAVVADRLTAEPMP